jgi:hypothetical protein
MKIYLAARYSRRIELCSYRDHLKKIGFDVQARWLNGDHQLSDQGVPIGEAGQNLVENGSLEAAALLREKFALDDFEDVKNADIVISFTEESRSVFGRGGRHVEFGIGIALGKQSVIVGHRENIFHHLPWVLFFEDFNEVLQYLSKLKR